MPEWHGDLIRHKENFTVNFYDSLAFAKQCNKTVLLPDFETAQ
jgi:hypothetical protein